MASINGSPATSAIVAINILFFLGVELTGGSGVQNLLDWGAKYGPYIAEGEYWRLFLPMFLHVGFYHMLTNLFGLVIFGSMVERIFGTQNFIITYLMAGIMGNVISFLAGPNPGVGASGAVFGILGAFGVYLLLNRRLLGQMGRQQLTSIGVIVAINIVLGLATTGIDNAAHFGGLLAGGFVAWMIAPRQFLFAAEAAEPLDAVAQTLIAARLIGAEAEIALAKSTNNLNDSNAALDRGREVVAEWKDRDNKLAIAEGKLLSIDRQIQAIDSNIADLNKTAEQLGHINADYEAHQVKIGERQGEIDGAIRANEILKAEDAENYAVYELATENWRIERQDWQSKRDSRSTEIVDTVAKLNKVKAASESVASKFCPERKQELTDEHAGELLALIDLYPYWESDLASLKTEYEDLMLTKPPESPVGESLNILVDVPTALGQDERIIQLKTKAENATELIQTQQIQKNTLTGEANEIGISITAMKRWFEVATRPDPDYLEKLLAAAQQALEDERASIEVRNRHRQNIALGEQALAAAEKAVETPFNFGTQRMALRSDIQPTSKLVIAIVVIAVVAVAITWFGSQSYVTNIFGQKIPG